MLGGRGSGRWFELGEDLMALCLREFCSSIAWLGTVEREIHKGRAGGEQWSPQVTRLHSV